MKKLIKGADLSTAIEFKELRIAERSYPWNRSHISGRQLRELAGVAEDAELFVIFSEEEEHIRIDHDHWVDVISEEIDLFYFKRPDEALVVIEVDGKKYPVKPGKYTVAQIKVIGKVPAGYDLEEVVAGKLDLLADNGSVEIKGCEVFKSHVKDGSSS
ncbi:MAG: multiubiquitin domain-containing protein [Bacteroidetes bacterium]|nr:multiubiquitin domain-containing protein [Bacteroidota bacterium]